MVISLCVLSLIILTALLIWPKEQNPGCGTIDEPVVTGCGNAMSFNDNDSLTLGEFNYARTLFRQNCAVCHSEGDQRLTGPGMNGVTDRVPSMEWVKGFIMNADSVIKSGDPYAAKLYREYDNAAMTSFSGVLSQKDVELLSKFLKYNVHR